jgi:actin-related protein
MSDDTINTNECEGCHYSDNSIPTRCALCHESSQREPTLNKKEIKKSEEKKNKAKEQARLKKILEKQNKTCLTCGFIKNSVNTKPCDTCFSDGKQGVNYVPQEGKVKIFTIPGSIVQE